MEDKITYGVFWNTKINSDEWNLFSVWFTSYEEARKEAAFVFKNSRCRAVKIVERVETFMDVREWKGENNEM